MQLQNIEASLKGHPKLLLNIAAVNTEDKSYFMNTMNIMFNLSRKKDI